TCQDQAGQSSTSDGGNARANTIAVPKAKRAGPWKASTLSLVIDSGLQSWRSDDELTTASRQGDKNSASRDQTRQSSADDWARHRHTKVNDASGAVICVQHIRREECGGCDRITSGVGRSLQICDEGGGRQTRSGDGQNKNVIAGSKAR